MLLRLIPEPPLPTILFTLAFGNLPDGVPYPAAWTSQLQHILHDELEMPQCIHALDKAAWAACLLHEVTFSVAAQRVSVLFVDGTSVEWPLADGALGRALKEVMDDVSESAIAVEMEQRRARAIQAAAQAQAAQERMPAAPSPSPAKGKHKKSRSLLMTLVASFCPSSQSSSPPALLPLPLAPPPPLTPLELAPPPPEPPQSSRYLRRKARGALVDIYRRYIIPALALESPFSVSRSGAEGGGGYILWNLQSILRRIEERMHLLGLELGSSSSSPASLSRSNSSSTSNPKRHRVSPSTLSESPFEEEEEDTSSASGTTEESESADTDASSVSAHTPRDVLPAYPVLCAAPAQEDESVKKEGGIVNPATRLAPSSSTSHQQTTPRSRRTSKRQSHPNRHPSKHVNNPQHQAQQHEYALLHASTIRLRALIARTSSFAHVQAEERSAALILLERKSRRRAWSSKQLMGGSEVGMGMREGLGVPVRESSLRWCWMPGTSEGVRQKSESERLTYVGVPRMPGGLLSARREMETEMKIELPNPTPILVPAHRVPSQEGSVPFPQTEGDGGDDFCSTGPQDTSRLFGGVDGEGEEFESVVLERTRGKEIMGGRAAYARSYSSDDLPGLFSSSSSSSPPSSDFEASAFEDSESEEMGTEFDRPFHTFEDGDSFDPPCDAFASALCFEEVSDFSMKLNKGTAGMGPRTRIHARRRAALSR